MTINIIKYSHNFALVDPHPVYHQHIKNYVDANLTHISHHKLWNSQVVSQVSKIFAVRKLMPLEYRFHISCLDQFIEYFTTRGMTQFNITEVPMYEPASCELNMITDKVPWGEQPELIEYLVSDGKKKVIELQAGQGKTFVTLNALSKIKQRAMLIIKPMYIQRWLDDLTKDTGIYKLTPEECVVISGSRELCNVIMQAQAGELNYKFIIMSNRTLANYYKDYRFGVNMEKYAGLAPHMLMETLGIGVKIIDEAHQDFHACYVSDLFTHVPKSIELSATLTPDDEFLRRMYENVYPRELRYGGGVYKKYVDVVAVPYRIDRDVKAQIKYAQRGRTSYSHGALEESLMKSKKRMMSFLGMVTDLTHRYFVTERVPGYKLLIFASRIEMCKIIADHLKSIYPEYKITKYTQEEDYSVLEDIDIIVSTPMSAGTAVDISRLQVAITTVSIGATQLNLQMLGRLRELRGVEKKPMFVYLYCTDIPKHVEYHEKKMNQTFKNKVNSYQVLHPPIYYV